jgi:hypothetical protein
MPGTITTSHDGILGMLIPPLLFHIEVMAFVSPRIVSVHMKDTAEERR